MRLGLAWALGAWWEGECALEEMPGAWPWAALNGWWAKWGFVVSTGELLNVPEARRDVGNLCLPEKSL